MIIGIGIDLIEIERVSVKISRKKGFKEFVFSKKEMAYCEKKASKFEHYAARFAAKEAFFKAIGTGWVKRTHFNEVEITHDETGKPLLVLRGETKKTLSALGITNILVSLTHLKTIASAVVIVEK